MPPKPTVAPADRQSLPLEPNGPSAARTDADVAVEILDPSSPGEAWFALPSWPGYYLSSDWRLWSRPCPGGPITEGPRKLTRGTNGYWVATMRRSGRYYTVYLHKIVIDALCGPVPSSAFVLHSDDDKSNNFPSNLYLGTQRQNVRDALRNGRIRHGERCGRAKLSDASVREIRALLAEGELNQTRIAARFGISPGTVGDIKFGRRRRRTV